MKLNLFFVFCLLIITTSAMGQRNFVPGYVIDNKGDTVYGRINYRRDLLMSSGCTFKQGKDNEKQYLPGEIFAYQIEGGKFYVSGLVDSIPRFLEKLVSGELDLYYYNEKSRDRYFVQKNGGDLIELQYFKKLVYLDPATQKTDYAKVTVDGQSVAPIYVPRAGEYTLESREFRTQLLTYLSETPNLTPEIEQIDIPNHRELIDLAKHYHEFTGSKQTFVEYRDLKNSPDLEATIGYAKFSIDGIDADNTFLMVGLKSNFGLPLVSDKLFIGLGFQYAAVEQNNYSYQLYKVPLYIRYQYPGHILKPYASVGFSSGFLYDGLNESLNPLLMPTVNLGMAVKVYEKIHLTVNIDGDLGQYKTANEGVAVFCLMNSLGVRIDL